MEFFWRYWFWDYLSFLISNDNEENVSLIIETYLHLLPIVRTSRKLLTFIHLNFLPHMNSRQSVFEKERNREWQYINVTADCHCYLIHLTIIGPSRDKWDFYIRNQLLRLYILMTDFYIQRPPLKYQIACRNLTMIS